jgi:hypothetical protein
VGSILLGLLLPVHLPLFAIAVGVGFGAYFTSGGKLDAGDVHGLLDLVLIAAVMALLPPLIGLGFGVLGLVRAARAGAPRALPVTGLVLCALNLMVIAINLVIILHMRTDILGKP